MPKRPAHCMLKNHQMGSRSPRGARGMHDQRIFLGFFFFFSVGKFWHFFGWLDSNGNFLGHSKTNVSPILFFV